MSGVGTIVVAAGASSRTGGGVAKQFHPVGVRPMLVVAVEALLPHSDEMVIVAPEGGVASVEALIRDAHVSDGAAKITIVSGGARRQDSVEAGLRALSPDADVVLVHDAARPFVSSDVIERVVAALGTHGAVVPAVSVPDTVKRIAGDEIRETVDRALLRLAQTPQAFDRSLLERAYAELCGRDVTDDAQAVELLGEPVAVVDGDPGNSKVTTAFDLELAGMRAASKMGIATSCRVGTGSDWHRLVDGRRLILCGVRVPFGKGLAGHSDADVATHAVCDALLGAVGAGDIGTHFPPDDPAYEGISSLKLLREVVSLLAVGGHRVSSVDVTIVAEAPRLAPFADEMKKTLAEALGTAPDAVSVKATTTEGLGPEGRGEAISAHAIALVQKRAE